jgi:hypothetical protein
MKATHLAPIATLLLTLGCPSGGVKPSGETGLDSPPEDSEPDTREDPYGVELTHADAKLVGESEGDYAGLGLAVVGDLDADGRSDLLLGAPGSDEVGVGGGKAYVVLGRQLRGTDSLDLGDAAHSFVGEALGDGAGGRVAAAGDVDGDGVPDLLVSAYESDDAAGNAGKVYLLRGANLRPSSGVSLAEADWAFLGEQGGYELGVSISGGGDVDGDGLADMVMGALGEGNRGFVHVVLGSATGAGAVPVSMASYTLAGEGEGDNAGIASSLVGDVDGDGLADLLIGAYGRDTAGQAAGGAYLVMASSLDGVDGGGLGVADHRWTGEASGDTAGFAVSGAGDVDGDGLADLIIGADCAGDTGELAGKAYLILAGSLGSVDAASLAAADVEILGEAEGDRAGGSVAPAGDVDGDGRGDVLVGACYASQGSDHEGKVYLVPGHQLDLASSLDLADVQDAWLGASTGDLAGRSVAGGGDLDADGLPDLLVGASHANEGGNDVGKVYVLFGWGI